MNAPISAVETVVIEAQYNVDESGLVIGWAPLRTRVVGTIETPGHLLAQVQAKMLAPVETAPYAFEDAAENFAVADALMEGHSDEQYWTGLKGLDQLFAYDA